MESGAPVAQLLDELLDKTGYREALRPSGRSRRRAGSRTSRSSCGGPPVRRDAADGGSVGEFLQQASLLADADTMRDDEGLVTLMTMHNAKGLEFPIVFMIGMEDGVFPHSRSIEENKIEEERRLAYVGLTRAMRDLTLTFARRRNAYGGAAGHSIRVAVPGRVAARVDRPAGAAARGLPGAGAGRVVVGGGRGIRRVRR